MTNEEKWFDNILTSPNPFSGSIVRSAWEDFPDVKSLNGSLTDQVLNLLQDVKNSHITKVLLIQGQAGIGKSHFLSRLRRIADQGDFLFVSVRPISDVTTIFNHVYRETFTSLRKKSFKATYTPMDSLISHILSGTLVKELKKVNKRKVLPKKIKNLIDILEKDHTLIFKLLESDKKSFTIFNSLVEKAISSIENEFPEVDLTFLNVLFKAINPELKPYSIRWLQGDDIPDDQLSALGARTTINDDQIAQRVLHSVMTLSDRPILLCFDQLESIYDRFGDPIVLFAFFDTVIRLCNETPNALVLLMSQAATWNEQIEPQLQRSAKDRIEYIEVLQTPTLEQLEELVKIRLDKLWGKFPYPPPSEIYPFTLSYLESLGDVEGWNPRNVIRTLARDINQMKATQNVVLVEKTMEGPLPEGTPESLKDFVLNQMNILISRFSDNLDENPFSARENYLEAGLFDLFKGSMELQREFEDKRISNIVFKTKPQHLDMILTITKGNGETENWGIEVCNKENSNSVLAVLRRVQNHLDQSKISNWYMLRDESIRIKRTWKKTNEMINSLRKRGGSIVYLDTETNAQIFACRELLDLSSAGDLEFNNTIVTRKALIPIIIKEILPDISLIGELFSLKEPRVELPPRPDSITGLQKQIMNILETTMLVNMSKLFPDFNKQEKEYRKTINKMKNENLVVVISDKDNQLVISKAPGEDIF